MIKEKLNLDLLLKLKSELILLNFKLIEDDDNLLVISGDNIYCKIVNYNIINEQKTVLNSSFFYLPYIEQENILSLIDKYIKAFNNTDDINSECELNDEEQAFVGSILTWLDRKCEDNNIGTTIDTKEYIEDNLDNCLNEEESSEDTENAYKNQKSEKETSSDIMDDFLKYLSSNKEYYKNLFRDEQPVFKRPEKENVENKNAKFDFSNIKTPKQKESINKFKDFIEDFGETIDYIFFDSETCETFCEDDYLEENFENPFFTAENDIEEEDDEDEDDDDDDSWIFTIVKALN